MLVSVIIPTHDPKYLREAVDSALNQTHRDLEVLVVPTAGAVVDGLLPSDERIRVLRHEGPPSIGATKRFAFDAAAGEVLVELDHDDLLMPDAVESVLAEVEKGAGFVYSNFAEFHDGTWAPHVYSSVWGWRSRPVEAFGRKLVEMISFDPTPVSFSRIWFSPHHVRAWTRAAYEGAGGHDPSVPVAEDHDLLVRTYLTAKMTKIDKCLYLYRVHDHCTSRVRNAEVKAITDRLYRENIYKIVARWCELSGLIFVHGLGSLHHPQQMAESSVGAFVVRDRFCKSQNIHADISAFYRALVPGGWLLSSEPLSKNVTSGTWDFWTKRGAAKIIKGNDVRFQTSRLEVTLESGPRVLFEGVALKDGYTGPGAIEI